MDYRRKGTNNYYIIGIDEVGRGSLAGPVVVAAVAIPKNLKFSAKRGSLPTGQVGASGGKSLKLRDSKQLSEKQRLAWFDYIRHHPRIFYTLGRVRPSVIDRINIREAANLAATRAVTQLAVRYFSQGSQLRILLDGGLSADKNVLVASGYTLVARTIIGGDEKYTCIKLASIVAKVKRDTYMRKLHKKLAQYQFALHKGYGTKAHMTALVRFGPSRHHRLTFLGNIPKLKV